MVSGTRRVCTLKMSPQHAVLRIRINCYVFFFTFLPRVCHVFYLFMPLVCDVFLLCFCHVSSHVFVKYFSTYLSRILPRFCQVFTMCYSRVLSRILARISATFFPRVSHAFFAGKRSLGPATDLHSNPIPTDCGEDT
jgi:hypothetical protein